MNIVYIAASEFPSNAANSVQVIRQSNGMAQIGMEVLLLARRKRLSRVNLDRVVSDYGVMPGVQLRLMSLAKWLPRMLTPLLYPLWAGLSTPSRASLVYGRHVLGLFCASVMRRPEILIYECHGPPNHMESFALRLLCGFGLLSRVVVISGALKNILCNQFNYFQGVEIIVAHDACEPIPAIKLREMDLSAGYVGSFLQGRGLDLVVQLAEQLPDIPFHLVGGDEAELKHCTRLPIPPNLVCHGRITPAHLDDVYRLFSVALAPYARSVQVPHGADTASYMSPLKIFEYMGWGKAIVASDLPVLREVLDDGVNALLATPEDIESWKRAILRLEDPVTRMELAQRAHKEALGKHTWSARAKRILKPFILEV